MAEVTILGALRNAAGRQKALQPVNDWRHGWRVIHEPSAGAWQRNEELKRGDLTCYPALYACLNRITQDIGKLPFLLKKKQANGIWAETDNPSYSPVLRKPNDYQTAQQFREAWILSRLMDGNVFVLKQRDESHKVKKLYVLDPCRVEPLVSEAGRVFYRLNYPSANNLLPESFGGTQITIPASEIIHDRINPFHHQLLGVPPLCAAALAAGKNIRILRNSSAFFENNAQPGGLVSGPAALTEEQADQLQEFFSKGFTGANAGRVAVIGSDLKFTPFAFKAADSQLVEQMRYSDEQICQPFGIPPWKLGIGAVPAGLGVDATNLMYHEDALSGHIEAMENLLDEALGLPQEWGIWLDTDPLFRMDVGKQAEVETKLVGGMVKTPNEARLKFGLAPTGGGDTLWGQKQDFPLQVLADNHPDMQAAAQHAVQAAPPAGGDDTQERLESANDENKTLAAELWQMKAIQATREAINA